MSQDNKRRPIDPFRRRGKVVSQTECTGLMPAPPQSQDEDEAYASLYAIHDDPDDP